MWGRGEEASGDPDSLKKKIITLVIYSALFIVHLHPPHSVYMVDKNVYFPPATGRFRIVLLVKDLNLAFDFVIELLRIIQI